MTQFILKMIYRYQIWICHKFHKDMGRPHFYSDHAVYHCLTCGRQMRVELEGPYHLSDDWESNR